MINMHEFLPRSQANGPGTRAVIWVQGCHQRCPGCFNQLTWPFASNKLISVDDLFKQITALPDLDGITISGGEPFEQFPDLAQLTQKCQQAGLTVVVFSGYTLNHIKNNPQPDWQKFLKQIDLLIDGPFCQELSAQADTLRGSSNQQLNFLSGRIKPEDINPAKIMEFTLDLEGIIWETGFPNF